MSRRLGAIAAAACAGVLAAAAPGAAQPAPDQLTLRLPDLPPGYELGTDRCEARRLADGHAPRALRGCRRASPIAGA